MKSISIKKISQLSPKAKRLYEWGTHYKRKYSVQKKKTEIFRKRYRNAVRFSKSHAFQKLTNTLSETTRNFFKAQINCSMRKLSGRRFTTDDKVTALALYKQTGAGYKFLSQMFALPSRVTVMKLLNNIPIEPGINLSVMKHLREIAQTLKNVGRYCFLLFDEMSIMPNINYNKSKDEVDGFENFGNGHRTEKIANHVQVIFYFINIIIYTNNKY